MVSFYSFLPLTAISILTLLFWRIQPALRPAWAAVGFITILCSLTDWVLLARLPHLGLSFGPVSPPLFMVNLLRLVPILLALSLIARSDSSWQRITILLAVSLFQLLLLGMAYNSLYVEPFHLTVSELQIPQAPAFLPDRPLHILQLTDLHVEYISPRERAMLAEVNTLAPDLIVLTGDYINKSYLNDTRSLQETRQLLSQLHAPYGVFAVNGNVDSAYTISTIFAGLDNIRVLDDETVPISFPGGTLYLVGVTTVDHDRDYLEIESLMSKLSLDDYSLLLYHYPERIDIASAFGVDLYLAGDTHGGQVRLPILGAVGTSSLRNPYVMGKYQVGPTTLYVSRGLGMQGGIWPRIRFMCPPEMVVVSLGK